MCQMRVILETDSGQEQIMEEVTSLEVTPDGIVLASMFDEPRLIPDSTVKKIDFMATLVTLSPQGTAHGSLERH